MAKYVITSINKSGNKVVSYTIKDNTSETDVSKDDIISLIEGGQIENAKIQIYKEQKIIRVKDGQSITRATDGSAIAPVKRSSSKDKVSGIKTSTKTEEHKGPMFITSGLLKSKILTLKVDDDNGTDIERLRMQRRRILCPNGTENSVEFENRYSDRFSRFDSWLLSYTGNSRTSLLFQYIENNLLNSPMGKELQEFLDNISYCTVYHKWRVSHDSKFETEEEVHEYVAKLLKEICALYLNYIGQPESFSWKMTTRTSNTYIGWLNSTLGECYVQAYNMVGQFHDKKELKYE